MQKTPDNIVIFLALTTVIILLLGGFILTIIFLYRRRQMSFEKEIHTLKADYDNNLLSTQLEIQEQLFQNISREIHDNISLTLTLAKLQLHTINLANPASAQESVETVKDHISKAILDLSDISRNLNADIVMQRGLLSAIETEISKLAKTGLYRIDLKTEGIPVFMEGEKELIIFRIIQESLNNIIKHAGAKQVKLTLIFSDTLLTIHIEDDGSGFNLSEAFQKKSAGLLNMKKRAELIRGSFSINSHIENGTRIRLVIPLNNDTKK